MALIFLYKYIYTYIYTEKYHVYIHIYIAVDNGLHLACVSSIRRHQTVGGQCLAASTNLHVPRPAIAVSQVLGREKVLVRVPKPGRTRSSVGPTIRCDVPRPTYPPIPATRANSLFQSHGHALFASSSPVLGARCKDMFISSYDEVSVLRAGAAAGIYTDGSMLHLRAGCQNSSGNSRVLFIHIYMYTCMLFIHMYVYTHDVKQLRRDRRASARANIRIPTYN